MKTRIMLVPGSCSPMAIRALVCSVATIASLSLGCTKLLELAATKEDAGGEAAPDAAPATGAPTSTASAPVAAVDAAAPPIVAKNAAPAAAATTRPRGKDGACPSGFSLVGPPTDPTNLCFKSCLSAADCPKGLVCADEEAFGGRTLKLCGTAAPPVAAAAKKPMAVPSPTTDRVPRNRIKDGPCPAGFAEQPGVEEHSSCARSCKSAADCHGHTCGDSDVGDGKVCTNEVPKAAAASAKPAAATKCKAGEIDDQDKCVKLCTTAKDCPKGSQCLPATVISKSAGEAHVNGCF